MTAPFSNAKDFQMQIGKAGGGAIAVDASDPNAAEPVAGRDASVPKPSDDNIVTMTVAADAACVVELWFWSTFFAKWVKLSSLTLVAFTAQQVSNIPGGLAVTLRVQANAGGATVIGAMFS